MRRRSPATTCSTLAARHPTPTDLTGHDRDLYGRLIRSIRRATGAIDSCDEARAATLIRTYRALAPLARRADELPPPERIASWEILQVLENTLEGLRWRLERGELAGRQTVNETLRELEGNDADE